MAQPSPAKFKRAKKTSPWPWQRRKSQFARPTLLDEILASPIKLLVSLAYTILLALRGAPFKPPEEQTSNPHSMHLRHTLERWHDYSER